MKDALYFSHDCNARRDPNIELMMVDYGWMGYGWYWAIVETMSELDNYKYPWKMIKVLAKDLGKDSEEFIHKCIDEYDLFESDEEYFWSESLLRRMALKAEKSKNARSAAYARWNSKGGDEVEPDPDNDEDERLEDEEDEDTADDVQSQSAGNADAMRTHSGSNAIKKERNKEKKKESIPDGTRPPPHRPFKNKTNRDRWDKWHRQITEVIGYYNKVRGRSRAPDIEEYVKLLGILFGNKYTVLQCRKVIDFQWLKWRDDEKMRDYHEPETLFAYRNFPKYIVRAEEHYRELEKPLEESRALLDHNDRVRREVEEEKKKSGGKLPEKIQEGLDRIKKGASIGA